MGQHICLTRYPRRQTTASSLLKEKCSTLLFLATSARSLPFSLLSLCSLHSSSSLCHAVQGAPEIITSVVQHFEQCASSAKCSCEFLIERASQRTEPLVRDISHAAQICRLASRGNVSAYMLDKDATSSAVVLFRPSDWLFSVSSPRLETQVSRTRKLMRIGKCRRRWRMTS